MKISSICKWACIFYTIILLSCGGAVSKINGLTDEQISANPELSALLNSLNDDNNPPEEYLQVSRKLETVYGNDEAAKHVLIMGAEKYPSDMEIYYELGRLQLKNGEELEGYQSFRRVMSSAVAGNFLDRISPYFLDVYSVQSIIFSSADEAYPAVDSAAQYVYYQTNKYGNWDIYRAALSGGTEEGIITLPTNEESPTISPGNEFLLFTSDKDDARPLPYQQKLRDIYYYDISQQSTLNLTENFSNDYLPKLCNSGIEAVFVSERNDLREEATFIDNYSNIFMMEPSGKFQVAMTKGNYFDSNPSISSCRQFIYFDSNRGSEYQNIYKIEIETKEMKLILPSGNWNNFSPSVNSSDTSMVYVSDRDGNYELYLYNFKTYTEERLTSADAEDLNPIFIPNSNRILFHSNRAGSYDIYMLDLDSKNVSPTPYSILQRIEERITMLNRNRAVAQD